MRDENAILVRKSNELVNARYDFDIRENRVFLMLLTLIHPDDEDFKPYQFRTIEFIRAFQLSSKDVYAELDKVTDGLMKKIVKITGQKNGKAYVFKASLVSSFEYFKDGSGLIKATFHPKLKPLLLQLKSQYLTYDIRNVAGLSSNHSLRLYELLKQYETIGTRTIELVELKELLGVADKYVNRYHGFKVKILLPAQKQLAKSTDLIFTFAELKQGRETVKIRFEIKKNPVKAKEEAAFPAGLEAKTIELLARYGIKPDAALAEILTAQAFERIQAVCRKAEQIFARKRKNGQPVVNESGYLLSLLNNPASFQSVAAGAKKRDAQNVFQAEKNRLEALKKRFNDELEAKTVELRAQYLTEEMKLEAYESLRTALFFDKIEQERKNGKENIFLKIEISRRLRKAHLQPEEYEFDLRLKRQTEK